MNRTSNPSPFEKLQKPVPYGGTLLVAALVLAGIAYSLAAPFDDGAPPSVAAGTPAGVEATTRGPATQRNYPELSELLAKITWNEAIVTSVEPVEMVSVHDRRPPLPDIDEYPLVVEPAVGPHDVAVEIFVTTHVSKKGDNGLHADLARDFNAADVRLSDGRTARVKVRRIASGIAYEYIASRTHLPDGFNPVHHLWAEMARESGVPMAVVRDRTVTSVAGVVMKSATHAEILARHGQVDIQAIVEEVANGELAMGYTNPFASSTGLDFLVSVLATYAGNDEASMVSPEVASAFEAFQRGVPFVAQTTLHMRDAVTRTGSLEAFILGYRTYLNTPALHAGYEFVPYGVGHHYPLYAVGALSEEKGEVLEKFARFMDRPEYAARARQYGWAEQLDYTPTVPNVSGGTLIAAQRLWKEKKDAGTPIAAVFICDVSGSMHGQKLAAVRSSLKDGSDFISPANAIGLVAFNDEVTTLLPVRRFGIKHKGRFHAAVSKLQASGGTAMYDAVVAGVSMLARARADNPSLRPMLFVLTDGETRDGLDYDAVSPVLAALRIPIFTIGYEADLAELGRLSALVEAATIKANEGRIGYAIGNLLNAQM